MMQKRIRFVIFFFLILSAVLALSAQSNEDCEACHADPGLKSERPGGRPGTLLVSSAKLAASVHKGQPCIGCHRDAAVKDFPHPEKLQPVNCGPCHKQADADFYAGIHGRALKRGAPYAPTCKECHGNHDILSRRDPNSRTYKFTIPILCGTCHREGAPVARVYDITEKDILNNYSQSTHGEALFKKGLTVTATCNDCHENHKILPHTTPESSISVQNIAKTCTQCHARSEQVHLKVIKGELWEKKPGAIPACTDCHRPHKIQKSNLVMGTADRECLKCHERPDVHKTVEGKPVPLTVVKDKLQGSVHRDIPCVKCHSDINPLHARPCDTVQRVDCSSCHAKVAEEYFESDHGLAFQQKKAQAPYCTDCHGKHEVRSHKDERDQTYRTGIPKLCGDCHGRMAAENQARNPQGDVLISYSSSVHGQGLVKKGLLPSAVCTDCHNTHFILKAASPQSSVSQKNIPATCAACHKGIYNDYAASIHSVVGAKSDKKLPNCEDCHSAHKIRNIQQDQFLTEVTVQCGSCHKDLSETYNTTLHGKAYALGYLKAARCSDCHGAHDIKGINDAASKVGFQHVVQTCQKCHPDANRRFTGYLTHATHHDRQKYPVLYFTFWAMTFLLIGVFAFFGVHTLLWMPRSFQYAREKKAEAAVHKRYYVERFTGGQRLTHLFVIISFIGLALTGMTLKFANMPWAQTLANLLGGVRTAGLIHRFCALLTFGYFSAHLASLVRMKIKTKSTWKKMIFGPRSLWFNKKDVRDFVGSIKWFLGRGPRPDYGRWTYWEKFDYLAVFWGVAIIGFSGLILWFPEVFTKILPGWLINVAMIIHSDEALLAVGFIFTVHFFNTHLRPESFPLDPVIFTGLVPLDEYRKDRPEEYRFLKEEDKLKKVMKLKEIAPRKMLAIRIFGFTLLFIGISLVLLIIYSMIFGYK
jgi:predicted CXXCH cytochrome family protein